MSTKPTKPSEKMMPAVRDAIAELADRRSHVKASHISDVLDDEQLHGTIDTARTVIGCNLSTLADEGVLEEYSGNDTQGGRVYRIVDDTGGVGSVE